jgi:alpha-ketoglutaric semialdehyde dehydrogenase
MKTVISSNEQTKELVNLVLQGASETFMIYRNIPGNRKAAFLNSIAEEIELLGTSLITQAMEETHLGSERLIGERARTCAQLRAFADMVKEGSWVEACIDTALPDRKPVPKPDMRKMFIPLGPVIVFGAANFPFAYSTAGGDTASALAAGCPVIVKAHPGHLKTSSLVAGCIQRAAVKNDIPPKVFQHIKETDFETGQALVLHPLTAAVGFTGSFAGGYALYKMAVNRDKPIPVFAEMSSVNPVCILPEIIRKDAKGIAEKLANAVIGSMGQFCTKPGLQLLIEEEGLEDYLEALRQKFSVAQPAALLHEGIATAFYKRRNESIGTKGVKLEMSSGQKATVQEGYPSLISVSASDFILQQALHEEVFGPLTLIIKCRNKKEMLEVIRSLQGQLTATIIGTTQELQNNRDIMDAITDIAGRIIINGVPTGLEVCPSTVHGGPFPATTDSRFTAVGISSVKRFVRPQCYQNFPSELLPNELKEENPLRIRRMVNGSWEDPGKK